MHRLELICLHSANADGYDGAGHACGARQSAASKLAGLSESKGINPTVSTYVEAISRGDQSFEMMKPRHGGTLGLG